MLPDDVVRFLRDAGLAGAGDLLRAEPLSGGVSSDIWRIELASGPVCVKRALPRLRVAQVWEAPVERNRYERAWLRVAGEAAPGAAPRILAEGDSAFAMEYLDAARYPVWKQRLREGAADPAFAAQVGGRLAAIHAFTAGRADIAASFDTGAFFHALRLEPYLLATGRVHADLAPVLQALEARTARTRVCLVHGDISPKNILVGPDGPVFLDAECAWYGDPAFDLAFCLNHLLLKCVWTPSASELFLDCFDSLRKSYVRGIEWEPTAQLEARAASLLPGLLLARIDGKSPVEYITEERDKNVVRHVARELLARGDKVKLLSDVKDAWQRSFR